MGSFGLRASSFDCYATVYGVLVDVHDNSHSVEVPAILSRLKLTSAVVLSMVSLAHHVVRDTLLIFEISALNVLNSS
jgi:hypothetical protein